MLDVDGLVRSRDVGRSGSSRPENTLKAIVRSSGIRRCFTRLHGVVDGRGVAARLDIVDRVDLGFEAPPHGAHVVPESVITATRLSHSGVNCSFLRCVATPDVSEWRGQRAVHPRALCVPGTEGATSRAVLCSPLLTRPRNESGGFVLRYARK
jgi:hypothetical protein